MVNVSPAELGDLNSVCFTLLVGCFTNTNQPVNISSNE